MKSVFRVGLVLFGLLFGVAALEVGLRIVYPDGGMPAAHLQKMTPEALASFKEDPECGYLPVVGSGPYGPEGCLKNKYDVAAKKGVRVLFVGDSVTQRGKIVDGLAKLYGDGYEYWNAGVESFNTRQEWVLYQRYNHRIRPDQIVLTFHNNDFRATPLALRENGKLKVYEPGMTINPWLFEKSYLYRWAWPRTEQGDRQMRAEQVRESLQAFQNSGVRFSVILLPILKPYDKWDEAERWARDRSLEYLNELKIRYFDLLPVLEQALKEGVNAEENIGDFWHPSNAISERFAQVLKKGRLLEE